MDKLHINKFIITLLLFVAFIKVKSQSSIDSLQIIIGNTITSRKQIENIKSQIASMPHTRYIGYCSNHHVFMLLADKNTYTDKNAFFTQLLSSVSSSELLLKEGEIKDIISFCEYENEADYDAVKKELDK
jgi:hypothetical protein